MKYLPRQNILWTIKQESLNSKRFKSHQVCSLATVELTKSVRERSQENLPNGSKQGSKNKYESMKEPLAYPRY